MWRREKAKDGNFLLILPAAEWIEIGAVTRCATIGGDNRYISKAELSATGVFKTSRWGVKSRERFMLGKVEARDGRFDERAVLRAESFKQLVAQNVREHSWRSRKIMLSLLIQKYTKLERSVSKDMEMKEK